MTQQKPSLTLVFGSAASRLRQGRFSHHPFKQEPFCWLHPKLALPPFTFMSSCPHFREISLKQPALPVSPLNSDFREQCLVETKPRHVKFDTLADRIPTFPPVPTPCLSPTSNMLIIFFWGKPQPALTTRGQIPWQQSCFKKGDLKKIVKSYGTFQNIRKAPKTVLH